MILPQSNEMIKPSKASGHPLERRVKDDDAGTKVERVEDEQAIAHVKRNPDGTWAEPHDLEAHLKAVADLAASFAEGFGNSDWARLAGLWHDLGKYKPEFQKYIRRASGYDWDESNEGGGGHVDHSIVGALHAGRHFGPEGEPFAKVLGYLIAGHHAGLPNWSPDLGTGGALRVRLEDAGHLKEAMAGFPPKEILASEMPRSLFRGKNHEHLHLWIRMLFSCLVDADFLDTEKYMNENKSQSRNDAKPSLESLKTKFDEFMAKKTLLPQNPVNQLRREILAQSRAHASWDPGLFSLTVPTGGGKTLSGMAFALEHSLCHGKRRIIVALPYTSIIEQTAKQYRDIFGDAAVLEHHCNLDPERESTRSKLASENWDSPIIVTTNVQLFESLFASRTSACRKLHNIADSVIILDEAQMLPPTYLELIVSSIKGLCQLFECSVVLSTATQPVLSERLQSGKAVLHGFEPGSVRELMNDPGELSRRLRRVEIQHHTGYSERVTWEEIAQELKAEEQVLCIVNTRKDCRELYDLMPAGTIHLSALMCPEHRSEVITRIKGRLENRESIRVISTQLVEAGVDFDFPVVYRALAGFDSIAQAAGRCNREGRLNEDGRLGRTIVFKPPQAAPPGMLRKGQDAGEEILRVYPDLAARLDPEVFTHYFKCFYGKVNSFDEKRIGGLLAGPDAEELKIQFRTAASRFSLIENTGQVPVIVWHTVKQRDGKPGFSGRKLLEELERTGPYRDLMRRIQRFTVSVPERVARILEEERFLRPVKGQDGLFTQTAITTRGTEINIYDSVFGLRLEGPKLDAEDFIA